MDSPKQELSASEAIYIFCGWLCSRKEKTEMSETSNIAKVVHLIDRFCKTYNLSELRKGWEKKIIPIEKDIKKRGQKKIENEYYAISKKDKKFLELLMKRLGTEKKISGDEMRDIMNRLFLLIHDLIPLKGE